MDSHEYLLFGECDCDLCVNLTTSLIAHDTCQLICMELNLNFNFPVKPYNSLETVYHCYHWNGHSEDFSYIKEMHFICTLNKLITHICMPV